MNSLFALFLSATLLLGVSPARAQSSVIPGFNVTTSICDPNFCPANKVDYAKKNNCKFLEDICPGLKQDNKGAKAEDKGFWGEAWDTIAAGATYGYEFMKGLATGLIGQVTDLWDLVSSPIETAKGLIELGKAFYDDPKGTIKKLAEVLGQEAVDSITQATQCGPYYLGNTIGEYVSPAVALKIAGKLGKFGKLDDAIKSVKKDFGCASFAADTTVWTSTGGTSIQSISIGQLVDSRHDQKWSQALQKVSNTFNRSAPNYYQLRTEEESFRVTEEHPLWVQGKGWTPIKDITDEDVLATQTGDTLVKEISKVNKPLQVYNFAVENTPNYFVGASGLWAHNAKCVMNISIWGPKANDVVDYAKKNNGASRPGYVGGSTFSNDGRNGGQVLSKIDSNGSPITYKEYDVNPRPAPNTGGRGTERVVIGSDGKSYYTSDHYGTFTEIK
jgi:single-stranded DNA-binding protein